MAPQLSRLNKREEKRQLQILLMSLVGIVAIITFLAVFGLKLLVQFSIFLDALRGNSPVTQSQHDLIQPPVIEPLPIATNSAALTITVRGKSDLTLVVYLNEEEVKRTPMPTEGTIKISSLKGKDGVNTLSAKLLDEKDNASELSNVVTTTVNSKPPLLEVTAPVDNSTLNGEDTKVIITGKTEEQNTLTVNDRFVVVNNDGSFSHAFSLTEGTTVLKITATDNAGNKTTIERTVNYHK